MIDKEFKEVVRNMRYCQNEYFKTRSYPALENSKKLERKVDQMIKDDDLMDLQLKLAMEDGK